MRLKLFLFFVAASTSVLRVVNAIQSQVLNLLKHSLTTQKKMASVDRATESEECLVSLYRPSTILPISRHRDALLYLVETSPVTIVVGQTGSGKTTQLPQYLHQAGWTAGDKMIACTQPRDRKSVV